MNGRLPRWMIYALLIAVVASWMPFALIARARAVRSSRPRIQIFHDMGKQPRYNPQAPSALFADGRAMRPEIPGTVARGQLHEDEALYRGRIGEDEWVTEFPLQITEPFVRRGQQQYVVFCAPCHGLDGAGNGPVHQRAVRLLEPRWVPPTSLHTEQVREKPVGHLYNTITNGIRNMAPYGAQIAVEDRWAIVAYMKALQLSRDASIEDVPTPERDRLR
jgi:hypothetical protein